MNGFYCGMVFVGGICAAAGAQFDFGNGNVDNRTGVAANVVVTDGGVLDPVVATVDGVKMTMEGFDAGGGSYGSNSQGFGIYSTGTSGAASRRINDAEGESVRFWFDKKVLIETVRMGSMTNGESFVISYVSGGVDPFGGGRFTFVEDGESSPTDDLPVNVVVEAGTVLELTTGNQVDGGVLWNDVVVSENFGGVAEVLAEFPDGAVVENPVVGAGGGTTVIGAGNAKGQSFSLAAETEVTGFVFEVNEVSGGGTVNLELRRGLNDLPWLAVEETVVFTLPEDLGEAGNFLKVNLPSAVTLERGTWTVALEGVTGSFSLKLSTGDDYAGGALIRKNGTSGGAWDNGVNAGSDLGFAVLGTGGTPVAAPVGKPNVIFVLADDLGWTDIRTGPTGPNVWGGVNYGSDFHQTPNLARMASEGMSFTHCFVHPNCAPTRAALFSGQYPSRAGNGVYHVHGLNRGNGNPALVGPGQNDDVPVRHVNMAEVFKGGDYVTAHFGKFHVGGHEGGAATLPLQAGFDYNFGGGPKGNPGTYFANDGAFHQNVGPELDRWAGDYTQAYVDTVLKPVANGNDPDLLVGDRKFLTDAMGDAAIEFMEDHRKGELKDLPFFMQFHFYAVHTPTQSRDDLEAKYAGLPKGTHHSNDKYAGLVENMDQTLGRLLAYLRDPNGDGDVSDSMAEDTLVVFCADNGGFSPTDNDPLRHIKGSFFNGGLRVPLIVWQPGLVPAGSQTDTLVHAVDFMPTLVARAGLAMPTENEDGVAVEYDGESFAAHLVDPVQNARERGPIFYHFPGYLDSRARAVDVAIYRRGGETYKLIYNYDLNYRGNNPPAEGLKVLDSPWELYRFDKDLGETENLVGGGYSNHLLYGVVADMMASGLKAWLEQDTAGWSIEPLEVRTTGEAVPNPPADVPDVEVPSEQTLRITESEAGGSMVMLRWNSESGFRYRVEVSGDLDAGSWSVLEDDIMAQGATTERSVSDPLGGSEEERFYRVVLVGS